MAESDSPKADLRFNLPHRVKSERVIARLFEEGWVEGKRPLTLRMLPVPNLPSSQFLFSAPKRRFRQASVRNQVKRRMKEALRLEWASAPESLKSGYVFGLLCVSSPPPSVATLRAALRGVWPKLEHRHGAQGAANRFEQ
ncbi:hypothetical protein GC167_03485 [bacterium]|nr:hypothetical protein [bacterium]